MLVLWLCICAVLTGTVLSNQYAVNDFDDVRGSFEFIYHTNQELLLTIYGTNCYYTHIKHIYCPTVLETEIMSQVRHSDSEHIEHSSLEELRNVFNDLLADYHCLDKHIYSLEPREDICDNE